MRKRAWKSWFGMTAAVLLAALVFGPARTAAAAPSDCPSMPFSLVEQMEVLPFGPVRLASRHIFDVVARPQPLPTGPNHVDRADVVTSLPPRLEWEHFHFDDKTHSQHWPWLEGDSYGGVVAGFIQRRHRLFYGMMVCYRRINARTNAWMPYCCMSDYYFCKWDIRVDALAYGAFVAYDILSEVDGNDPVTVAVGVAVCHMIMHTHIRQQCWWPCHGFCSPSMSDVTHHGIVSPFVHVYKNAGPVIVGAGAQFTGAIQDHGNRGSDRGNHWLTHQVTYGPYIGVPIGEHVMVNGSFERIDIFNDDRGGRRYPGSYYMAGTQVGVAITRAVKVFVGFRRIFGIDRYTANVLFGGGEVSF